MSIKYIGDFRVEFYTVFLDNVEVCVTSVGGWSDLNAVMNKAEQKLDKKLMAGKKVLTRYMNVDTNEIKFWTYKEDEWWTL